MPQQEWIPDHWPKSSKEVMDDFEPSVQSADARSVFLWNDPWLSAKTETLWRFFDGNPFYVRRMLVLVQTSRVH